MISRQDSENLKAANANRDETPYVPLQSAQELGGFRDSPAYRLLHKLYHAGGIHEPTESLSWREGLGFAFLIWIVIIVGLMPAPHFEPWESVNSGYKYWASVGVILGGLYISKYRIAQLRLTIEHRLSLFAFVFAMATLAVDWLLIHSKTELTRSGIADWTILSAEYLAVPFLSFFVFEIVGSYCRPTSFKLRAFVEILLCLPIARLIWKVISFALF